MTKETTTEQEQIRKETFEHFIYPYRSREFLQRPGGLKTFVKGEGVRITDIEGKTFIDGAAGWQFCNVGDGRTEIGDAIRDQITKLVSVAAEYNNIPRMKLATKLAELAPGNLTKVAFCNSGSEAVETALKMAKQYHALNGEPTRFKIIARRSSYHGWTWGAMSIGGAIRDLIADFEPLGLMARHVAQPYCYRCDYGLEYPSCNLLCAKEIENVIQFERPNTVSAVIGEVISHSANICPPPSEYWPMVRSVCDKYGVLLIDDEVITGFGRTGKWFGCMHYDYVPDILTFAKGITSGYIPLGGAITTPKIASKFEGSVFFSSFPTWGGNPVSAAGALANIDIMERENLVENSVRMGDYLLKGLQTLLKYPIVGDVRGIGLMCAVELVADKKTKAFFKPELNIHGRVFSKMEREGLLCREFGTTILLTPALCITKSDIDEIVAIVEKVISEINRELGD